MVHMSRAVTTTEPSSKKTNDAFDVIWMWEVRTQNGVIFYLCAVELQSGKTHGRLLLAKIQLANCNKCIKYIYHLITVNCIVSVSDLTIEYVCMVIYLK